MFQTTSKKVRRPLIGIGAVLLLAAANAVAIEEPQYDVVKTYRDFELRRYAPYLVAETEVSGEFDEVGNTAFRILAGYIFGDNRAQEKMEMTAPVTQRAKGGADTDTFVLSFVMPARYSLRTLPEPLDPRVRLREETGKLMAVLGYSGRWTEINYRENESLLLASVEGAGFAPVGAPVYARYNSPFSLWFLRRNEVMVEVEASQ